MASTTSNIRTDRLLNGVTNPFIHSNSNNETSTTWVDSLTQLDELLSGTLFRLCYDLISIALLSLGLYYGTKTCSVSNALAIISICILVFSGLALTFTLLFFVRNWSMGRTTSGKERILIAFFYFLRFICICVGTAFVFTSKIPINNDCEILRFYLGIVCFNTWFLLFTWIPKPSLPVRTSLIFVFIGLLIFLSFNGTYFGFLAFAMIQTHQSECIYSRIEDLYFHAPLKSFAFVGLVIIGCIIITVIFGTILSQLYYRFPNLRRLLVPLSAIHYMIFYFETVALVYYFSVGAVLLFRPRLGGSCFTVAPGLYKILWIWQLIRVFFPLVILPLVILIVCVGVAFGTCLSSCLPPSIAVPLMEILHVCFALNILNLTIILSVQEHFPDVPNVANPNPVTTGIPNSPMSPGTIDALPMVVFGQVSDEFNQTEWSVKLHKMISMIIFRVYIYYSFFSSAICRADYEVNEEIKRLPCNHLFHARCVARWLSITRICPVCRKRVAAVSL